MALILLGYYYGLMRDFTIIGLGTGVMSIINGCFICYGLLVFIINSVGYFVDISGQEVFLNFELLTYCVMAFSILVIGKDSYFTNG